MILGFKSDNGDIIQSYIKDTSNRLLGNEFVSNPFTGTIHQYDDVTIFILKPIYPNLPLYCIPAALVSYVLFGMNWSVYVFLGFGFFSIFWSSKFYQFIIKIGLAKKGYKGKLEFV
jgi:hypothetical protein